MLKLFTENLKIKTCPVLTKHRSIIYFVDRMFLILKNISAMQNTARRISGSALYH